MPRQVHVFDPPERFVAGTVGQPGERTFFLQAAGQGRLVSVALEKVQVSILADRLTQLLDEARRQGGDVPAAPPPGSEDTAALTGPIEEEFRVGTLRLGWDPTSGKVLVEARAQGETTDDDDDPDDDDDLGDGPDVLRVLLDPGAARAFVTRALRVVAAGRPPCPLCGLPLDPQGHICPRQNGHRR